MFASTMKNFDYIFSAAPALLRNGVATPPNTMTARRNHGALLTASRDVGYSEVGRAVGHDKSWVSRALNGDCLMSMPELLTWLDKGGLRIIHECDMAEGNAAEVLEAVNKAAMNIRTIEDFARKMGEDGEIYIAIAALARRALAQIKNDAERGAE